MIQANHILALSERAFVRQQVRSVFCAGTCDSRRPSFWRGWGLDDEFRGDPPDSIGTY